MSMKSDQSASGFSIARFSEGNELPLIQHFRSNKTSYKYLNALGKIISVQRHY